MAENQLMVGGQAVIEGVMMRTPDMVTVACRRADGAITVWKRPYRSLLARYQILAWPIFRGAVVLLEALVLGMQALTYSGDLAERDARTPHNGKDSPPEQPKSASQKIKMGLTLALTLALGLAIFFYVPLVLTDLTGARSGFWFNLIDGLIRMAFFLGYVVLISRLKEIQRVFEYHGAEHKSIFNYEANIELTPANAARFSRFHPRCGTSFLLIVMIVSIFVFMLLGRPDTVAERLVRLLFIPVIGGVSYELIRLSAAGYRHPFWRALIAPGLWLQRLTTREPDAAQLEVALVALQAALGRNVQAMPQVVVDGGEALLAKPA